MGMGEPSLRSWALVACAVLGASLAGCTKTGLAWVNEPESGVDLHPPPSSEPGSRSVAPATTPTTPTMRPGLDWPSVPNYGPAFPYHMGPASPWSGSDGRRR